MLSPRRLVVIAGPTGSGKSELALRVAERFAGEVVNCDSIQIYRFFDLGAAKLPIAERRGVPHHLIDVAEPPDVFTAGDYAVAARPVLTEIADRGRLPVVTGGTGFYIRALIDGLAPGPSRDEALRVKLGAREAKRAGAIHRLLTRFDAPTAARIHPHDIPKSMRALEICLSARRSATQVFAAGRDALAGFRVLKIGLFPDRDALYSRLEKRMDEMFAKGLLQETEAILARGYNETCKPFEAIGYKQALQLLKREISPRDALFYAKRDTRHYAKRQMTWFRQEKGLEVFSGFGDDAALTAVVEKRVEAFLSD